MANSTRHLLTAWSAVILLWVVVNIVIAVGNQSIQTEVAERQEEITQTFQLETLHRQLLAVLAEMALKTNDEELKKILAESGIQFDAAPASPPPKE